MGYWDSNKRKSRWDKDEPKEVEKPQNGDNIDFKALDKLESDLNNTTEKVLDDVEGIAESIKKQKAIAKDMLSSNYWFAVCFNNETQKRQFLEKMGFDPSWTFIQGNEFARAVKVTIKEPDHDYSKERRVNPNFKARAREIKGRSFKPLD